MKGGCRAAGVSCHRLRREHEEKRGKRTALEDAGSDGERLCVPAIEGHLSCGAGVENVHPTLYAGSKADGC